MDLFAKAVKSGIAKGYAIGKQELQQHLVKQRESGSQSNYDNTSSDYGAQHTAPYPNFPQQPQQQQQTYAAVYSGESPPLPPRQYQPPQPQQPNYVAQRLSQNLSAIYECTAPARPEYSYSSIMPPPPPSYIPLASAEAAYSQGASSPYIHYENANTYNETVAHINSQFPQQPSHEIPACNRPVNVSLTPTTESFHGQEQIHAREDSEVFVLNNETGRVVLDATGRPVRAKAMQQGQLSLMYSGMNSMAAISGTDDGSRYGNSSLGWYETENGATGAQMFQNMQTGMADANRGDEWMQIFQLELAWREVE